MKHHGGSRALRDELGLPHAITEESIRRVYLFAEAELKGFHFHPRASDMGLIERYQFRWPNAVHFLSNVANLPPQAAHGSRFLDVINVGMCKHVTKMVQRHENAGR